MMIHKLNLNNYRTFEDIAVEFHPKLTVIVGQNGTGKTTVLEAAAIAAGTLFYSLAGVVSYGIKKSDAHYKCFDMGSVIDVQPQYPVAISAEGIVEGRNIKWKRTKNSEEGKMTVTGAKEMTQISAEYQQRLRSGDTSLILPVIAYYGTGRLWDQHREKKADTLKKNTRTNGYLDCLDGTANVKLMLKWFQKMALTDGQSTRPSPEFAAVRGAVEQCFALMTGIEDVKVQFNPDTLEIDIAYMTADNGRVRIPLNQMSDGYRCTLSLIADIAYRMAILNPQLLDHVLTETNGVILIDEIDLHLHPAWQQRVLSDLTSIFPNVQFIVTTHAPAVINSVKSENLVILNNNQILHVSNQVYGKDIKSVLNEIMGVTERPPEVAKMFAEFYRQVSAKNYDEAEEILNEIDELRGYHDQEVAGCRVKLKLERIRGRRDDWNTKEN